MLEQVRNLGHIHGVLAFSDGGALALALTIKAEMGLAPKLWDFIVLVCALDPYLDEQLHMQYDSSDMENLTTRVRMKTPSLHIIGLRDDVYRKRSERLWTLVHPQASEQCKMPIHGMAAEVYRFDDGHKVPTTDADIKAILAGWRRVVIGSGLYRDVRPEEVLT